MQLFTSQFSSTSSTSGSSGDMHSTHPPACSVNSVHDVNSSLGFIDTVFKDLATRTNSRKMYSPHLYKIPPASCPNSPQSGQSSEASFKLSKYPFNEKTLPPGSMGLATLAMLQRGEAGKPIPEQSCGKMQKYCFVDDQQCRQQYSMFYYLPGM